MIEAKPVVDKKYWILKKDNCKIGALEAEPDGYTLRILDQVGKFKTIPMVRKKISIEFAPAEKITRPAPDQVHGYDTGCRAFNPIWDVKHRLPLFTKERKSKSWYAAGYYAVKQHRAWKIVRNPKMIVLERYQYQGPFHTQEAARDKSLSF
jgi:hypothetical protein